MIGVREAARRLGVHENTVRNWADQGVLESDRLPSSGFRRFHEDDVYRLSRELRKGDIARQREIITGIPRRDLDQLLAVARLYLAVYTGAPPQDGLYQDVTEIVARYEETA